MSVCGKRAGTRPWWMGEYQYRPCTCLRPEGHPGDCQCEHVQPTDLEDQS